DRWLRDALTSAAATHAVSFLPALTKEETAPSEAGLAIADRVAEHLGRSRLSAADLNRLLISLKSSDKRVVETVLAGLNRGWPRDYSVKISADAEAALVGWLRDLSPAAKGQLVRLGAAWGSNELERYSAEIVTDLLTLVADKSGSN